MDDSRDNANSLAMVVPAWGHEARATYCGDTALVALQDFTPDAMVVDLMMPGMDGNELARQVRARSGLTRTKLIVMSGLHNGAAQGLFDHHLLKPADLGELERLLTSVRNASNGPG